MYFKRKIALDLEKWLASKERKPLVLQGARQVGKTSLLKDFGKISFEQIAYFNFEEKPELKQIFNQTKDVNRILQNLSLVHGSTITPGKTLIIFDEIQECRSALNSLKYFRENASEYIVASAGSLLGITLGQEGSFPVGQVDFLTLYPLTFIEFLERLDPALANYLNSINTLEAIPDIFFNSLVEKFKMYFISGGLPEPARILVESGDIERTQQQLRNIHEAYILDFSKHVSKKDIPKIGYIWNSLPSQLGRENKKFLYQTVKSGARARDYEDALLWLVQAGLVIKVNKCNKPNIPLSAYDDLSGFKIYMLDVGVLRSLARLDPIAFLQGHRLFTEFKGALTENYILQAVLPQFDITPRYWTSEGKAEVDFLFQYKNEILPAEVKSDENVRSKSLTYYHQTYHPSLRIRYSLKNLDYRDGLLNIPLFMADFTLALIDRIGIEK
ncbi:MAG: AAA family ATPase [Saprospiraceae bacterium]